MSARWPLLLLAAIASFGCGSEPEDTPIIEGAAPQFEQAPAPDATTRSAAPDAAPSSNAPIRGRSEGLPRERALTEADARIYADAAARCPLSADRPGPEWTCAAFRKLREAGWHRGSAGVDLARIGRRLGAEYLRLPNRGKRVAGARMLQWQGLAAKEPSVQAQLVSAFVVEKEPAVALALLDALEGAPPQGDVGRAYTHALKTSTPALVDLAARRLAVGQLAPVESLMAALTQAAQNASSPVAQASACMALARIGSPSALESVGKLLGPDVQPMVEEGCLRGLVAAWAGLGKRPQSPSAPAYQLTIERLRDTPPGRGLTPTVLRAIGRAQAVEGEVDASWRAAAPFVDPTQLVTALVPIIEDSARSQRARLAGVEAAVRLGLSPQAGHTLRGRLLKRRAPSDRRVADALTQALPK